MRFVLRVVRALVPILVSGALLVWLAHFVDYQAVFGHIRVIPVWSLLGATAAFLVSIVIGAWRYALVVEDLASARPSLSRTLPINFLSLFLTYLVPIAVLADVARIAASCRMLKLTPAQATRCVVHDRVLALAGLVLSAGLVVPLLVGRGAPSGVVTTTVILVAGLAGGFGAVGVASVRGWASPSRIIGFFVDSLRRFPVHLSNAPRLARQLVCVLATTLSFAVQLYLLAVGLGVALPPIVAIACAPLISLAQVVPFLYGGYGAREAAVVALLGGSWASPDAALALGLAIGVTNMAASLPGALAMGWFVYPSTGGTGLAS